MTAFSSACATLRSRGLDVTPADIPGLTYVNGTELTMNQIIGLAGMVPSQPRGCICPPTSEKTCKGPMCPRQGHSL